MAPGVPGQGSSVDALLAELGDDRSPDLLAESRSVPEEQKKIGRPLMPFERGLGSACGDPSVGRIDRPH